MRPSIRRASASPFDDGLQPFAVMYGVRFERITAGGVAGLMRAAMKRP
jgi:hypothetical protein